MTRTKLLLSMAAGTLALVATFGPSAASAVSSSSSKASTPSASTSSGQPAAGTVGKADAKTPPGQSAGDPNRGYECDNNPGIGDGNPAHAANCPPPSPGDCNYPPSRSPHLALAVLTQPSTGNKGVATVRGVLDLKPNCHLRGRSVSVSSSTTSASAGFGAGTAYTTAADGSFTFTVSVTKTIWLKGVYTGGFDFDGAVSPVVVVQPAKK